MAYRWVPLIGEFEVSGESILFKGKEIPPIAMGEQAKQEPTLAVGLILSDQKVLNGTLSTEIEFSEISAQTVCEIVIGYDVNTKGIISAGLGGSFTMFSIREWVPSTTPQNVGSWVTYEQTGNRENLRTNVKYYRR